MPVNLRCDPFKALEKIDEVAGILIVQFRGDLRDALVGLSEDALGQLHLFAVYITHEVLAHLAAKEA